MSMAQKIAPDVNHPSTRDYSKVSLVYTYINRAPSACRYYRIEMPLKTMSELGLAGGIMDSEGHAVSSTADCMQSDVFLLYALGGRGVEKLVDRVRGEYTQILQKEYKEYIPPVIVWDTDDNQDWVHPLNPAFVKLGTRNIDGSLLEPGDTVWARTADDDAWPIWIDEVSKAPYGDSEMVEFDVWRNLEFNKTFSRIVRGVDGVTTPSPHLAKYMKENWGAKEVYVFPNSVDPTAYSQVEFAPRSDVKIMWQGGASHAVDLFPIRNELLHVMREHPQTKFFMWGSQYTWITETLPKERVETLDWVPYGGYIPLRSRVDMDINICPLADNEFNRGKSAIKWYEASLSGSPEATLAAKVPPYSDEIIDGETGMLYGDKKEFVEKLTVLVENKELRKTLASNAKKWVIANRDRKVTVPKLYEYYDMVRKRQVLSYGV